MFHRFAIALASVALLLGGLAVPGGTALARPCLDPDHPTCGLPGVVRPTGAEVTVTTYFADLNDAMATGKISTVTALYTRAASLTLHIASGQTQVVRGSAAIGTYITTLRAASSGATWQVDEMRNLTANVVLVYARVTAPTSSAPARWAEIFVIKSGRIASLESIAI